MRGALWNFAGDSGTVEHDRPGTAHEELYGCKVDRALLDILTESRAPA